MSLDPDIPGTQSNTEATETLSVDQHYFKKMIVSAVVAVAILTLDLSLQLGVAGGVPYVVMVVLGVWFGRIREVYLLATIASALTILGYFASPGGGVLWIILANRGLALFAIWVMALMIASRFRAEESLKESEEKIRA